MVRASALDGDYVVGISRAPDNRLVYAGARAPSDGGVIPAYAGMTRRLRAARGRDSRLRGNDGTKGRDVVGGPLAGGEARV